MADGDVADGGGFDFAGPTDDEGDAVAGLKGVGFLASHHAVGPVAAVFFHVALFPGCAVVAGDDDEGVGGVDGSEDFADAVVDLFYEITVELGCAAALEFFGGDPGGVGGGEGDVAEEGPWLLYEVDGSLGDFRHDFFHTEAGGDGAAAIVGSAFDFAVVGDFVGGLGCCAFAIEVEVGWHVEGGGDAEKFVEAVVERAEGEVFGEVDGVCCAEAEVPFAEAAGAVAVLLEEAGDGGAAVFYEVGGVAIKYSRFEAAAPGVTAR